VLREHQRNINRAIREIDRERTAMQNQEKKITIEMKKLAKQGQMVCFTGNEIVQLYIREQ
jgi:charged multivesicular body protein 2A